MKKLKKGWNQMEMMFVISALMTMMVASLALQYSSYRRIKVVLN